MTNFLINIKNHYLRVAIAELVDEAMKTYGGSEYQFSQQWNADGMAQAKEGANKQVISSQADSLIKISRIWADFFPANTSN